VLQYASERNVTATDDEVRAQLGTQLSLALDDPNFDARIQEEIVGSGLSEEQFYDVARAAVLRRNIIESFKADVPGTLPAVHYRQIQVADQATADSLVEQLNDGADFIALAEKNSEDSATKALGGDKGFVPEGLLDEATEDLLFSLEVNEFATFPTTSAVFVYEVLEKSDDYDVTNEQVESLAQNAYLEWRTDKEETLDIKNEFDFTDGDGDKIQYVIDHAGLALS
jgi:parvulin-like peptidyl-prolyl isomerase